MGRRKIRSAAKMHYRTNALDLPTHTSRTSVGPGLDAFTQDSILAHIGQEQDVGERTQNQNTVLGSRARERHLALAVMYRASWTFTVLRDTVAVSVVEVR